MHGPARANAGLPHKPSDRTCKQAVPIQHSAEVGKKMINGEECVYRIARSLVGGLVVATLGAGCASNLPKEEVRTPLQTATDRLEQHSQALLSEQEQLRQRFQEINPVAPPVEPVAPSYDPLEGIRVTLDVEDANVHHVLRALAAQVDMNLVIHPNLVKVPNRISVHFRDAEASRVFREVLRISDVAGTIEGNMLVVNPMEEQVFHLDFMETTTSMNLSAGGDVLGASQGSGGFGDGSVSAGRTISGNFQLQGSSAQNTNPYDALENMLRILIGTQDARLPSSVDAATSVEEVSEIATVDTARRMDTPSYVLNRITGTLFVRARPSVVSTVNTLVARYREVLSRQILIEAQILEVALSEAFSYGVDWEFLHDRVASTLGESSPRIGGVESSSPDLRPGPRSLTIPERTLNTLGNSVLGLNYFGKNFGVSLNLLKEFGDVTVISNPTIRTRHGQPALIGVGTSTAFVSETGSTILPTGATSAVTQSVQTSSVFDGLILGLLPFIADNGSISMIIHPVQSNVNRDSLVLVDVGADNRITLPEVALKEISTTIGLNDGDLIMLGGLIDHTKADNRDGVPGLSRVPIFGKLFESKRGVDVTRELVIVLKVTEL